MVDLMDIEDLVPEEFGGICGMLAPIIVYIFTGISILIHPGFDWSSDALSKLGAVGTSYNNIFNFGLMIGGIAGLIFTFAIFRFVETKGGIVGVSLFGAGVVCLILVGVFPQGNTPHVYVSLLFFILSLAGMIILGVDQLWDFTEAIWGIFILSSVILIGISLFIVYKDIGTAMLEFLSSIPIVLFLLVFGARLYFE